MKKSISIIFNDAPDHWGLRGDPFLWKDLDTYFSNIFLPCSERDFLKEFHVAFEKITGKELDSKEDIFCSRYDNGGMSSGMISSLFWLEKALPLLTKRLRDANNLN